MTSSPYAKRILDQLLEAIRPGPGEPPDWHLAEPYLRRHAIQHAADARQVDELLSDPEFLVYADPATLGPETQGVQSAQARLRAAIWWATVAHQHADPGTRRQLLALDAARFGQAGLAEQLASPTGRRPALAWVPVWATGSQVSSSLLATLSGHQGGVLAVAVGQRGGRPVVVSGGGDGTVRVWDLASGEVVGQPLRGHQGWVRAVAVGQRGGRPVVVSGGGDDGTVRVWDLASGEVVGEPLRGHQGGVLAVAVGQRGGRPVVVSGGDDGTVRVWDLASGEVIATIAFPDSVSAVAAAPEGWLGAGFGWEVAVLRPTGEPRRATGPGDGNAPPEPPGASAGGLR